MANINLFVTNGKKIVGVAANYRSLLKLMNKPIPNPPEIFLKPTTSYITEEKSIVIPKGFSVNEEIELGVIINTKVKNIPENEAMKVVGGYCVALDMTAACKMRQARATGNSWTIGKGFDTATPVGAFIPRSYISDPHNLQIWSSVNGKEVQSGSTSDMVHNVSSIISYISRFITLEPCDLILTGTPPWMTSVKHGDIIEGGIKGYSEIKFNVVEEQ